MNTQLESLLMEGYTVEMSSKKTEDDYTFLVIVRYKGVEIAQSVHPTLTAAVHAAWLLTPER